MKQQTLETFIAYFEKELNALILSAKAAHSAATHEESRAEDRHDTFAIEASYLAAGQAERVKDLRKALDELNQYLLSNVQNPSSIAPGVLVTLESENGKITYSLICKNGGGTQVKVSEKTISLVSPSSPLGDQLIGLAQKDSFTFEAKNRTSEYFISAIC
jgi:transcription elongation GreA/GreB family factor